MSACMSGTRSSGVLSSTGDVLVRGVGRVRDMCMCLARGGVGGEGSEWMRELGLPILAQSAVPFVTSDYCRREVSKSNTHKEEVS